MVPKNGRLVHLFYGLGFLYKCEDIQDLTPQFY
jgi:hypothetical protein